MLKFELVHRNGDQKGVRRSLEANRLVIGRSRTADLQLGTPDVSRKHCALIRSDRGVMVQDLGSRNGTKLNGEKIGVDEPTQLSHRDKLQIGRWKFRCLIETPSEEPEEKADSKPNRSGASSESSADRDVLDELDDLAATVEFSTFHRLVQKDLSQSVDSDNPKNTPDQDGADPPGESEEDQKVGTNPAADGVPSAQDDVPSTQDKNNDSETPTGPKKLPEHLRPKGPRDSTQAADLALRKLLGG